MDTTSPARSAKKSEATLVYPFWLTSIVWLPFTIPGFIALFQTPFSLTWLLTCGVSLLFVALYVWTGWDTAYRLAGFSPPRRFAVPGPIWAPIAVLLPISVIILVIAGPVWGNLFVFTSACACCRFSPLQALQTIAGLDLIIIAFGWLGHVGWSALLGQGVFTVTVVGFTCMGASWAARSNSELRLARQELARLAVSEERLRFARDLHDLLGHTLSLIALKSELAGRLVHTAPEQAVIEIGDVERAAREALHEVREAVTGYRQTTLASELRAARQMLTAAGVVYTQDADDLTLPPPVEAALSWAVREGVTNVIRHSRARHCAIRVARRASAAYLEITDDGRGAEPTPDAAGVCLSGGAGSGLRGLAERMAALGGACASGPRAGGGFRLAVSVPLAGDVSAGAPAPVTPLHGEWKEQAS